MAAAVLLTAGLVGVVAAADPGVSSGARATQPAVRGGTQIQVNPPPPPPGPATARYRVTLNIAFNSATHPGTAPPGAHVSNPVVAAHSAPGAMFVFGGFASPGIERMAELGQTSTLVAELGANPTVTEVRITGGDAGIFTRRVDLQLTQSADLISLVTMLAPSPDWFVGFADRDLFVNGQWVAQVAFPLGSYDAGTDSGSGFTSGDVDTQPRQPISGPRDAGFVAAAAQQPFGSVVITRIG